MLIKNENDAETSSIKKQNIHQYLKMFLFVILALIFIFLLLVIAAAVVIFGNPSYDEVKKRFMAGGQIPTSIDHVSFWNIHVIIDWATSIFSGNVPFSKGVESRSFKEHVDAVKLQIQPWQGEGMYEVEAQTLEGTMYPAFRIYRWYSDTAPTLIFHHAAFEYPFDGVFKKIFDNACLKKLKVNLIVVRTPFHRKSGNELLEGVETLSKFIATMAVSVKLTEELIEMVKKRGVSIIEVSGISLGGVISNRHHILYNSASFYVPVIAGMAHEYLFIEKKTPDTVLSQREETIKTHLNFTDEWNKLDSSNVFPILARYDLYSRLDEQGATYGTCQVEVWERGHITTALSFRALRFVLLRHLLTEGDMKSLK